MAKKVKNNKKSMKDESQEFTEQGMTGSSVDRTAEQQPTNNFKDENTPGSNPLPSILKETKGATVTIVEDIDLEKVSYADGSQQSVKRSRSLSRPERHRPRTSAERRRIELAAIGRGDTGVSADLGRNNERRRRRSVASHLASETHLDKQRSGCWTITSWIVTFWALPLMLRSFGRSIINK
jgi:hypothetical protein